MTLEELRKEFYVTLEAAVMAEREACAKLAESSPGRWKSRLVALRVVAKNIANDIRARPMFKLPPMALDLDRNVSVGVIVPQKKSSR